PSAETTALRRANASEVERALRASLRRLPAADRLALRLRYAEDLPVPVIARLLQAEVKPLYGRLERLLKALRRDLGRAGIDVAAVARLLAGLPADESIDDGEAESGTSRPSIWVDDGSDPAGGDPS